MIWRRGNIASERLRCRGGFDIPGFDHCRPIFRAPFPCATPSVAFQRIRPSLGKVYCLLLVCCKADN